MKSPDEIKRILQEMRDDEMEYSLTAELCGDALAYIESLEARRPEVVPMQKLEDLRRGAVVSKFVTARECEAYRRAIADCQRSLFGVSGSNPNDSGTAQEHALPPNQ